MPTTHVQITEYEKKDGDTGCQYRTTVPKGLAEFFDMDSETELEWSAGSASNKLEVEVKND